MTQPVRVALVGAGEIGAVHAQAHTAVPGNHLAAVYDVNAEQAGRLADQTGAVVAPNLESVLDDPRIDGVDLCVPNHLHRPLAVREQVAYFAECIRTGQAPAKAPPAEARRALALALASRESCESGQPVGVCESHSA